MSFWLECTLAFHILAAIHLVLDFFQRLIDLLSFENHAAALGECTCNQVTGTGSSPLAVFADLALVLASGSSTHRLDGQPIR